MDINDIMDEILNQIKQPLWENWYIKEKVGSGTFSAVFKVEAKRSIKRTSVSALKIEPITTDGKYFVDEERKRQYLDRKLSTVETEAEIMYSLRKCPYIVIYEEEDIKEFTINGVFEGYYYLIRMEYLESVFDKIYNKKFDYSEGNVLKLAYHIAQGIKAAHDIGVIHRDIKLENFFVDETGLYKLGDFNISTRTNSARTFAGTHGYLAPEIYRAKANSGEKYTNQADIYSFGICLYQLMNNLYFPFEENSDTETAIDRRMNGETLTPPNNASHSFARIILKACEFDTDNRYKSMGDMIYDLECCILENKEYSEKAAADNVSFMFSGNNDETSENVGEEGESLEMSEMAELVGTATIPADEEPNAENGVSDIGKTLAVSDCIEFGRYCLSDSSYKSPIKWRILDIDGDNALVISECGIDGKRYNDNRYDITWASSSIRRWLNNDFMQAAFNNDEKKMIIQRSVNNGKNPLYPTTNGGNTVDYIFLLSIDEVNQYFKTNADRQLVPTPLACSKGISVSDRKYATWWLRSSGNSQNYAADVDSIGEVDLYGSDAYYAISAVRPAMWISLSSYTKSSSGLQDSVLQFGGDSFSLYEDELNVGDKVHFGKYLMNNFFEKKPIIWTVLYADDGKALLLSDYGLDCVDYDLNPNGGTWKKSKVRGWLNDYFYSFAFTETERALVLSVSVHNADNSIYKTVGGKETIENVFLLSSEEVAYYFKSSSARIVRATDYAVGKGAFVDKNGKAGWWLRTQGNNACYAAEVDSFGDIDHYGSDKRYGRNVVRPAIWIDFSDSDKMTAAGLSIIR